MPIEPPKSKQFDLTYKVHIYGCRGNWWAVVTGPDGTNWDSGPFEYGFRALEAANMTIESHMDNVFNGREPE